MIVSIHYYHYYDEYSPVAASMFFFNSYGHMYDRKMSFGRFLYILERIIVHTTNPIPIRIYFLNHLQPSH
ncbi:hypothetical protein BH23THE1_BH23THE1_26990 [soil metagenome]